MGDDRTRLLEFAPLLTDEEIAREKAEARRLRRTRWWRKKCAKGVCHWCGRRVPPSELTMDHVVPLARGGRSTRENLVPACRECNRSKGHRLAFEWAREPEDKEDGECAE